MNWTLEVVRVPVSDLDRAKEFYGGKCGFTVDLDDEVAPGTRIVQVTPPGSRCSIALVSGLPPLPGTRTMAPGTLHGLQLCVTDIEAAREKLVAAGVAASPVMHMGPGGWEEGKGPAWNSFLGFEDPDGNGWILQEAPTELSER
ncbi:VOC family protein [Streptomyces termitum]|uniref:Glyoxalase n=1 Tax=Streptomyces termitum TaxID=67368 RepID=A0A918T8K6_9ACTN|nr:VOC family protein [Streptomyces termitum]GHB04368.1 glyoxalase [Streptomyces termitum]